MKQMFKELAEHYELPEEALKPEFFDFLKIVKNGSIKYAMDDWLTNNGKSASEFKMHDSMFHHLSESYTKGKNIKHHLPYRNDLDSGLDPLLHLACRALMLYTRRQRGLTHNDDK